MPITLTLTGHIELSAQKLTREEARDWLGRAAVWFEGIGDAVLDARVVRDSEDKPVLLASLHPSAQPIELRLGASGRVKLHAVTTPAGPGYHAYLCDLLRQFGEEFDLSWEEPDPTHDPTRYFITRDRAAAEARFTAWLVAVCSAPVSIPPARIGMPSGIEFDFLSAVQTPLGPHAKEWSAAIASDRARAREYFPWWTPTLDAAFYRNRALVRLWCDFPWRPPLTEAEGELTDQIANDLATAFKLDPAGDLPWAEWLEILAAIADDREGFTVTPPDPALIAELTTRASAQPERAPIGYRRLPIRISLNTGWSIGVPGDFTQEWEGDRTWTGWNASRTVWFHALGFTKPDGTRPSAIEALELGRRSLPEGEPIASIDRDDIRGEAVYGQADEDGRTVWRLSGVAAVSGQLAVCNVYSQDANDRDWAIATWQSLRHVEVGE
jgi:hypothetical protein